MIKKQNTLAILSFALLLASCRPHGWTQLSLEKSPPSSGQGAVAYMDSSQSAILFGGITVEKWLDETWVWNGETWYQVSPLHVPPARAKLAMEYDRARDKVVLFGGEMDKTLYNDTWEWDGNDWQLMDPKHTPSARCCHAMAYDSVNKNILLYGGYDPARNVFLSDVWKWDGNDWSMIDEAWIEMSGHSMVSVPDNKAILSVQTAGYGTWAWDGKTWSAIMGENPPTRSEGKTAYDSKHHWVVFFGGIANAEMLNDTWIMDDGRWLKLTLPEDPPARFGHVVFYDPTRESIILFGGIGDNNARFGDTWELKLPSQSIETLSKSMSYNGDWKGKTSQGQEITFTVAHNGIMALNFRIEWKGTNCNKTFESKLETTIDPTAEATGKFTSIHPIANRGFLITQEHSGSDASAYMINGTFSSTDSAAGTLSYTVASGSCQGTREFNWSATRVSP